MFNHQPLLERICFLSANLHFLSWDCFFFETNNVWIFQDTHDDSNEYTRDSGKIVAAQKESLHASFATELSAKQENI